MHTTKARLQSGAYTLLLKSFTEWLALLNYSALSLPAHTTMIKEFLLFQQQQGKPTLQQLSASDATSFIQHLKATVGERTARPLSAGHLNKCVQSLKLFSRYLRQTGRSEVGFTLERFQEGKQKPVWLTKAEIQQLYEVIKDDLLGIRDRAMLAVFYGCGLRLNEGACLEVGDINQANKVLHVRKAKHYKERFVPIAQGNFEAIKAYLDYARPQLLQELKTEAFFIRAQNGHPLDRQGLYVRIKQLAGKAKLKKRVGTHTLRHSIATHLLQSGMKLERIQQFLGHTHLDSTQRYTHLKNESL